MTIEVEVVRKEIIRPSSPTPHHLQIFPLSGPAQLSPSIYTPFFLFFSSTGKNNYCDRVHRLKQSLADTLTHIYPLAGRINHNQYINCNDEGVNFFESRVSGDNLSQFLSDPPPEELHKLLPREKLALLSVQVNIFYCGGMGLGVLIDHKVSDGFSDCLILNCWASVARGEDEHEIHPPKLRIQDTIPPSIDVQGSTAQTAAGSQVVGKIVSKRFVFSAANIGALRANMFTKPTSRFSAVSALIWRCAMNAERPESASVATFVVNLRPKQLPHLSENSFGNCITCTTTSTASTADGPPELQELVDKLKEAIKIIDSEYMKQLKAGDEMFLEPFRQVNEQCSQGEVERYLFSSMCNFPFYQIDFGWGKPIWLTTTSSVGYKNAATLMDTKCGSGVEAWVALNEGHMDRFERDPLLIAFTSVVGI